MSEPSSNKTFLELVNLYDNVHIDWSTSTDPNFESERIITWSLAPMPGSPAIGLLRPQIVDQLRRENEICRAKGLPDVWIFAESPQGANPRISFNTWVDTPSKRSAVMKELCERWRDTGLFEGVCGPKKWRGELYPVYANPLGVRDYPSKEDPASVDNTNFVFEMERSACALFGIVTFGVHMTIYQDVEETGSGEKNTFIWVPTRARTKQTWPGYLDNSVAGGIPSGMGVFESIVKESEEEASLDGDIVRKYAKSVGAVSYCLRTSQGWLQPEIEYVLDLRIPPGEDIQPKPHDNEVESFEFLPLDVVVSKLRAGLFKPNCGLVLIDFLIRHGHLTPDNEDNFMEILTRLHGRFGYEMW